MMQSDLLLSADHAQLLDQFQFELKFPLDGFQRRACEELLAGHSVLVCAPTGAGKTIVGQFAIFLALEAVGKCFYTTPIKALSNQKFDELVTLYGPEKVGLLTGDSSINPSAPIIVMTTEVLRNMLYARSKTMRGLAFVVMDEVHFLADRFRGAVWEEIILTLPAHIKIVGLSATVSNAEEFGQWIDKTRGETAVIVDENRPVPLYQHMLVGSEIIPVYLDGKINPQLNRAIHRLQEYYDFSRYGDEERNPYAARSRQARSTFGGKRKFDQRKESFPSGGNDFELLDRAETIQILAENNFLPVIYFIFSRAGCDDAVRACLHSSLVLNPRGIRKKIDEIIQRHITGIDKADLEIIGFYPWRDAIYRGFAAHHAGMLATFRRAVEELFSQGLLKVVFATETLALGINMPARSVFVEKLTKYNGENHVYITPGEFTQLTGRAGRRGIDTEGHAMISWRPGITAREVAILASTRTFPLNSSFVPVYNMALNLLETLGIEESIELIGKSFAQYQADRKESDQKIIDTGEAEIVDQIHALDLEILESLPQGTTETELQEYLQLEEQVHYGERAIEKAHKLHKSSQLRESMGKLHIGEIISLSKAKKKEYAIVAQKKPDSLIVINQFGKKTQYKFFDFSQIPEVYGVIPPHLKQKINSTSGRAAIGKWLQENRTALRQKNTVAKAQSSTVGDDDNSLKLLEREVFTYKVALKQHKLFAICTDSSILPLISPSLRKRRIAHSKLMRKSQFDKANLHSLTRIFSRIILLLTELGYITDEIAPELTEKGYQLLKLYSESDLLIAQCLDHQIWNGLLPEELAAVVSTMVFESRNDRKVKVYHIDYLSVPLVTALKKTMHTWESLARLETSNHLKATREPDLGFVVAAYTWAQGGDLEECLELGGDHRRPQAAGDFVRWMLQVIDILEQIVQASNDTCLSKTASRAAEKIRRGIILSGMIN